MTNGLFADRQVAIVGRDERLTAALRTRFEREGARLSDDNGTVDIWIQVCAPAVSQPAEHLNAASVEGVLADRLIAPTVATLAAGQRMLAAGGGVIVNVVSHLAYMPSAGSALVSSAEASIVMLTQALGVEWAKRGVRVVGVAVGHLDSTDDAALTRQVTRRSPMHRFGTMDEAVEAIVYVASSRASYVVGETLRVDGGWTAYQLF